MAVMLQQTPPKTYGILYIGRRRIGTVEELEMVVDTVDISSSTTYRKEIRPKSKTVTIKARRRVSGWYGHTCNFLYRMIGEYLSGKIIEEGENELHRFKDMCLVGFTCDSDGLMTLSLYKDIDLTI